MPSKPCEPAKSISESKCLANADVGDATPLEGVEKMPSAMVCNCSMSKKHRSSKTDCVMCHNPLLLHPKNHPYIEEPSFVETDTQPESPGYFTAGIGLH